MQLVNFGPRQIRSMYESLTKSKKTSFDFSSNALSDQDAEFLLKHLQILAEQFTPQYHITLANNRLRTRSAVQLQRILRFKTLVVLDLNNNRMGDRGCSILINSIQATCAMSRLQLNHNEAGSLSAKALGALLKRSTSLMQVHMAYNNFDAKCSEEIFEGLYYNKVLLDLDLSWNSLGGGRNPHTVDPKTPHKSMPGMRKLCKYLKLGSVLHPQTGLPLNNEKPCKLRHLNLAYNQFPAVACRLLAQCLQEDNKGVQCIHMAGNAEGLDGRVYDLSKSRDDVFARFTGLEDVRQQVKFQRCVRCWICERWTPVRITWDPHQMLKQDFLLPDALDLPRIWTDDDDGNDKGDATSPTSIKSIRTLVHV